MSIRIKHAYKKHNTWVYRRVYPKPLQGLLGSALKQSVNAGLKLHQSPEQQCTIWQILVGVKVRHFSGCRFVHRPARRSAPTEQRSCAGLWSNRGAVFAL